MASTSTVNVFRYSALTLGVFYGFYHQRSITVTQRAAAAKHEYEHKQKLIEQAKAEYAKSKLPPSAVSAAATGGLNQDANDPKFDLESYLTALSKEYP